MMHMKYYLLLKRKGEKVHKYMKPGKTSDPNIITEIISASDQKNVDKAGHQAAEHNLLLLLFC